ncbi:hypothetical protein MMC34_003007 [Xylographa carneopallida]|nr:hypothetical protein [Xylographa carneopallida]
MQATKARLIEWVGKVKPRDITDELFRASAAAFAENEERKYPRIKKAEIKGSRPHLSHDDPSDKEEIITVEMQSENGSRLGTFRVHQDGSGKLLPCRRFKNGLARGPQSTKQEVTQTTKSADGTEKVEPSEHKT